MDGLATQDFLIAGRHCERCVNAVAKALMNADGVIQTDVNVGGATVEYIPQLVSVDYMEEIINGAGYQVLKKPERKGFFGRFLDRMIASNEKNFGNQRLDCCSLPKDDSIQIKGNQGTKNGKR